MTSFPLFRVVTVDRGFGLLKKGYDLQAERPGKYKRVHLVQQVIEAWEDDKINSSETLECPGRRPTYDQVARALAPPKRKKG